MHQHEAPRTRKAWSWCPEHRARVSLPGLPRCSALHVTGQYSSRAVHSLATLAKSLRGRPGRPIRVDYVRQRTESKTVHGIGVFSLPTCAQMRAGSSTAHGLERISLPTCARLRAGSSTAHGIGLDFQQTCARLRAGSMTVHEIGVSSLPTCPHSRAGSATVYGIGLSSLPSSTRLRAGSAAPPAPYTGSPQASVWLLASRTRWGLLLRLALRCVQTQH